LPVTASLAPLDLKTLRAILTKPKNALVRQYERLVEMDQVELVFTPEALDAAAELALERETGARGLRSIIEGALLDVMYEIPSRPDVRKVVVDENVIRNNLRPQLFDTNDSPVQYNDELPDAA